MRDLNGRRILITGASSGIGHALAEQAAAAGASVLLAARSSDKLAELAERLTARGMKAIPLAADVTVAEDRQRLLDVAIDRLGGLDVLINVAGGFFSFGPFTEVKPEILDRELAVNFKTAFFSCQAAVPVLLERGGGAIVNFASIAAVRALMHMSAYSAAKSAVAGLTRELAREYRDANIRVNAVAPATVRTADNVAQMEDPKSSPPLVELDEVVNTVLFLASDAASAITGQIIPITGKAY